MLTALDIQIRIFSPVLDVIVTRCPERTTKSIIFFSDIISFSQLQHHFAHPQFSQFLVSGILELDVLQCRCYLSQNFLSAPATNKHLMLIQAASLTCFLVHDLKAPLRIFAP